MKSPIYNVSEFKCVRSAADLVRLYTKIQTAEARRKRHEGQVSALQHQLRGVQDTMAALSKFSTLMSEATSGHLLTDQERKSALSGLLPAMVKSVTYPTGQGRELVRQLLGLYGKVDTDRFRDDLMQLSTTSDIDTAALIGELEREEGLARVAAGDVEALWEQASELFSEVPLSLPDDPARNIPETEREKVRETNAKRLVLQFVQKWKERSQLFSVPVTAVGVAIDSLPIARREDWQGAYEMLQLDKLPKRPYFSPVVYQKSPAEKEAEMNYEKPQKGILSRIFA